MTKNPTQSRTRFGFALVGLARRWRLALDERLSDIGLSDAVWPPLVHLDRSGDAVSQTELAHRCGVDNSTLVRLLDILARQDLVERRVSERDRRSRLIILTDRGREALVAVYAILEEIETAMLADVSDEEIDQSLTMFDRIEQGIVRTRRGTAE
ncbi:MAG: hypothetical protein RLZZ444_1311 [Pseudomonadota bacterium]|jgi:MarR family transcriptional regulator for hemolysin